MRAVSWILIFVFLGYLFGAGSRATAASEELLLRTDKSSYAHGEGVEIIFTNNSNSTVALHGSIPFTIWDELGRLVFPDAVLWPILFVFPGTSMRWTWDQFNYVGTWGLVPPGIFNVTLVVFDANAENIVAELWTIFEVREPAVGVDTDSSVYYFVYEPSLTRLSVDLDRGTYCNLTVAKQMLKGSLTVLLDNAPANYTLTQNSTFFSFFFTYNPRFHNIMVLSLLGDIDLDGLVDIFDLVAVGVAFGSTPSSPDWNQGNDLNNDNVIDVFDIVLAVNNFGKTRP